MVETSLPIPKEQGLVTKSNFITYIHTVIPIFAEVRPFIRGHTIIFNSGGETKSSNNR